MYSSSSHRSIAILVTTHETYGFLEPSLRSWWQQRAEADAFEVILACHEEDAAVQAFFQAHARPHDRLFVRHGWNQNQLLNLAAEFTRADHLFITEPHVMAHPDLLTQVFAALQGDPCSLSVGSKSFGNSHLAAAMHRNFENDRRHARTHIPWHNFVIRGTALPRCAYLEVGGLHVEYGHFGEVHLGIKLAEYGLPARELSDTWTTHVEGFGPVELAVALPLYVEQEALARRQNVELMAKYLPLPPNTQPRATLPVPRAAYLFALTKLRLPRPLYLKIFEQYVVALAHAGHREVALRSAKL